MKILSCTPLSRLAGIALLVLASFANAGEYNAIMTIGDKMPAFTKLPSTEGTPVSSDDIKESVVVLVSLANHCPWVKGMDAALVDIANSFKGKDVRFIGFSVNHREDDRLPAMKTHAEKVGYDFTYVYDESQELGRKLGATRTPEYFVFDKYRTLQYMGLLHNSPARLTRDNKIAHINGEPSEFYVKDAINSLLASKKVAVSETRAHGCSVKYENKS